MISECAENDIYHFYVFGFFRNFEKNVGVDGEIKREDTYRDFIKEDVMSVIDILKPHNLEAFQEIDKMIELGTKKIAAPRATGSGKTYLMGALAEKYNDDKKLVLEPTRPLLNSIEGKFDAFGITNTDFITYQK